MSNVKWAHAAYYAATGKAVGAGNMTEKDRIWVIEYEACHSALRNCQHENSVLKEENQRLKHENEFMLRLINDRMSGVEQ